MITFETIRRDKAIWVYIQKADETLKALGFTEHSFAHVTKCAQTAHSLLSRLGYAQRTAELAQIAAYLHDIGNVVNRKDHAQSGAMMAFRLLDNLGMDPEETAVVISAIGHHDEATAFPVNEVAAALILADKTDVRRTRVRNIDPASFDIHDRVNYAVEQSELLLCPEEHTITLELTIDNEISAVMDYFEIFLGRMVLCRKAAVYLDLVFHLVVNGSSLL